jgi:transposase-like protein
MAVKLFVLEVPVNRAYRELGIAYNTTHKIYSKIRELIYRFSTRDERVLSGEIEMDESYFGEKRFANGKVYINGIEGFWSYAKERLLKFHCVRRENFVYYIKELKFRYNNRDNLEEVLYKVLSRRVIQGYLFARDSQPNEETISLYMFFAIDNEP